MKWRAPLTGADAFLRIIERMMLAAGQGQHLGLSILRLGTGFDATLFREAVERFAAASPIAAAQLRQPFFCLPRWQWTAQTRAHFPIDAHRPEVALEALCQRRLNEPLPTQVRFDLLAQDDGGTSVVMCWRHLLLDGKGAELLLAELARLASDPQAASPAEPFEAALPPQRGWRAFAADAERFKTHFYRNARWSIRCLAGADPQPGEACFALETFSSEETARIAARAAAVTRGLFSLAWFLAAAMRAQRAIFLHRGEEPASYQASCAVQERKRGARHPIWQNRVSQLFFCVPAERAKDLAETARELHEQFVDMTRARMPEAFASMTGLLRRLPASWYLRFVRGHSGGHITSFFYSHTGQFLPECEVFAGAAVLDGWHVPSVSAPPGTGLFFSERAGRLTVTLAWREGAISAAEVVLLRSTLRADLLGP